MLVPVCQWGGEDIYLTDVTIRRHRTTDGVQYELTGVPEDVCAAALSATEPAIRFEEETDAVEEVVVPVADTLTRVDEGCIRTLVSEPISLIDQYLSGAGEYIPDD